MPMSADDARPAEGQPTEATWRSAAEAGDAGAACELAALLAQRGDVEDAEQWYRRAASAGNISAANNLAFLLDERGNYSEAERWYRRAAEAGNAAAARNLAILLRQLGDTRGAEEWHRRASAMTKPGQATASAEPFTPRRGDDAPSVRPPHKTPDPADTRPPRTISKFSDSPPVNGIADVITNWDRLLQISPEPATAITYLARRSGLPFNQIDHLREVRNCCAHPNRHGWPSQRDVDTANATAQELLLRVGT